MNFRKNIFVIFIILLSNLYAQSVPVTLHYKPVIDEFTTLRLVGNFNGWNNNDATMVMTDPDGDGVYEITKDFAMGVEHLYKFVFDASWSFAWNDPDNPDIKISDNDNSILNVKNPNITYLLPRGQNTNKITYVDTTVLGEPIRAIFAFTPDKPIDLTSLIVRIDNVDIDNPSQYYDESKQEFSYQPPVPLAEGSHTVFVSIKSDAGTTTKYSVFKREPGLVIYKAPMDFYYDENNTGSSVLQNIENVSLVGNFNNWNELFDRMQDDDKDGLWEVTTSLEAGDYEYKFKLNNSLWIEDPDEPNFSPTTDNNVFSVEIDSIPSIKLLSPKESTTFKTNPSSISFKTLLRPGVLSTVDEASIVVSLDGSVVSHVFTSDSSIVSANLELNGEGSHLIKVEFTNMAGLSISKTFAYGVYTNNTGLFYADAIGDIPYSYPSGVPVGSGDILSVLMDEVSTHDSLQFDVKFDKISDRTRLGLLISNPTSSSTTDLLNLDIGTEDWKNEGVFIPIGTPGNLYENTDKENTFWENRDPVVYSTHKIKVNSDASTINSFNFKISLAYLDSLLGSWTRERSIYLFSYLADTDKSGNGYEVTELDGGSDAIEDPDIYDAAFFRSGFWQDRVLSNYIPAGQKMGPRLVSLNGFGRGKISLTPTDISDSLATYGPAINFLTPSVTYWYEDVSVKGELSDSNISKIDFSFNGVVTEESAVNGIFNVPVVLTEGENTIFVIAKDSEGFQSTSKNLVLYYEKNHKPKVSIGGTVSGRVVSLSAIATSPDLLNFTYAWDDDANNPSDVLATPTTKDIQFSIPEIAGEYYINVNAKDSKGRIVKARKLIFATADSVYFAQNNDHASWIDDAIFYEIYPRSYSSAGNFDGIKNKIPEMKDLGINAIWLMPIYTGPTVHGYEITDYFGFEEDFGTADDFRSLVEALHNNGIKVVLDYVVNHTSIQHPFMQNVLEYGEESPWADFYIWSGEPGNSSYEYFFDWASLPNLNHNNTDVREYFIKAALYWVEEFDIDGYRCDVAWGVQQRNSLFWTEWRAALKNLKPELFLEAEASSSESIYYSNRFDSANDWDLRNNLINAVSGSGTINDFDTELSRVYPTYARPFRFVENHDEVRVASSHDTQRSKLMHTILMMANGVPLIYSGGEVGELTNRGLIDWSDPDNIRPYFKALVNIRAKYLTNPTIERITNSYPDKRYTFTSKSDNNLLLTFANFDNKSETRDVFIERSQLPNDGVSTYYLTNLFNGNYIEILQGDNTISLDTLDAYEAIVYYFGTEPVTVDVKDENGIIISDYELSQNYPNPFNPSTKIEYQIPKANFVTIKVYDILGREVATLVNSQKAKGKYDITFAGSGLTSGIYFYTMKAGDFVNTKKLILLK